MDGPRCEFDAAANGKRVSLAGTTTVNVTPVNDPPVAQNDSNSLGKAATTPVTGTVLSNDSDADADPLSVTGLTGGAVGVPLVRNTGADLESRWYLQLQR